MTFYPLLDAKLIELQLPKQKRLCQEIYMLEKVYNCEQSAPSQMSQVNAKTTSNLEIAPAFSFALCECVPVY